MTESSSPITLTVNSRLARWLLLEFDERCKKSGKKAWQTPLIYPLDLWLKNLWLESWPTKFLLTPLQSEKIWEKIISKYSKGLGLLHLQGISSQASQAFSLINQYRLPLDPYFYEQTEESKAFLKWVKIYNHWLLNLNAIDSSTLMDAVRISMDAEEIPIPSSLCFKGFEERSPQLQAFLTFLKAQGTDIQFISPIPNGQVLNTNLADTTIYAYDRRKSEAEACARWVRSVFKPGKRIGIIVPELEKYRSLLKRELEAELVPKNIFNLDDQGLPFNISLAPALSQEPMIKLILDILSTKTTHIPINKFLSIIQSPFFGFEFPPPIEILNLERELQNKRFLYIPLDKLDSFCQIPDEIKNLLDQYKKWVQNSRELLPERWAEILTDFLKSLSWPGILTTLKEGQSESLLAKYYQTFESWKECLNEFSSLGQILGPLDRTEAINHFTEIVRKKPFQTKTPEYSIQVIGLLESSGMKFDHLWIMGCHSETLPSHPDPNSFIPYEIRNRYSIPRSNPKRELRFAEQSLIRLLVSSPKVIFSYPLHEGGTDLKLSPLLQHFPKNKNHDLPSNKVKDQVQSINQLEEFTETIFLPATNSEKSQFKNNGLSSGYGLIKDQVECPFRAFANHRLNCEHKPIPEIDYDNLDRGNLIHKTLEIYWKKTKNLENLLAQINRNTLKVTIEQCVQKAMDICSKRTAGQKEFNKIEVERNIRIIHGWLLLESKRPEFEVLHNEESFSIELGGIKIKVRIDRIDRIENKGLLLIDYKTGREAKPVDWFAEKLRAPQLPLYAMCKHPEGLAYAHISIKKSEFKGITHSELPLGPLKNYDFSKSTNCSSWGALLDFWKNSLIEIIHSFLKGNNQVNPLNMAESCRHCGLAHLCRVQGSGNKDSGQEFI